MLHIVHKMSFGLMCMEQYDLKCEYQYTVSVKYCTVIPRLASDPANEFFG
jgi:hypothetical protein